MKTNHFAVIGKPRLPLLAITILALSYFTTSCTKPAELSAQPVQLSQLAEILKGEIISGNLTSISNEGFLVQDKGETKIFLLEKNQRLIIETPGNLKRVDVLYCQYGVLISDFENNTTWLYINNDEESRKKFEPIKNKLNGNQKTFDILGLTRINLTEI